MNLSSLKPAEGSVKQRKRVGRGQGSGRGATSTRGRKGAQSRSGYSRKRGFEGGQMPLQRRVPKFGFKNINRVEYKAINLDVLDALAIEFKLKKIDFNVLREHGLVAKSDLVKVLNRGSISVAVDIHAKGFSASAKMAIEAAGGKAIVE